jgi:NAD(P)-dependent dehydrogenase (short-subunit alcohol dehydrogenase family)
MLIISRLRSAKHKVALDPLRARGQLLTSMSIVERDMTAVRKAIFITGGGSGIGRAVAREFAERGWLVGLADINQRGLDETAALLPEGRSTRHIMDVRDRDQWAAALADFARSSEGRLDVLFNNAGIGIGGHFPEVDPADADRLIAVNFGGVVNGVYAALPLLKATPGSAILNTGSASGYYGSAGMAIYSATKHAVRALTEALDIEFSRYGIKVRDLMPSFIDTPILDATTADSNAPVRERLTAGGIEISPVSVVASAAWDAVQGDRLHTPVGPTAKQMAFFSRWLPSLIVKRSRKMDEIARSQG